MNSLSNLLIMDLVAGVMEEFVHYMDAFSVIFEKSILFFNGCEDHP